MIRTGLFATGVIVAVMLGLSAYAQMVLPEGTQIATHWGINGEPDQWSGKLFGLWFVPVLAAVIGGLIALVPHIEPRRRNLIESSSLYLTAWIGGMAIMLIAHASLVLTSLGFDLPMVAVITASVGVLLAAIGNVLGKSRSSFFIGIRTPWTLSSEYSWEKTHRLAGRLWVLGGSAMAITSFFVAESQLLWVLVAAVIVMTAIPLAASFVYWREDPTRGQASGETGDA